MQYFAAISQTFFERMGKISRLTGDGLGQLDQPELSFAAFYLYLQRFIYQITLSSSLFNVYLKL